MKFFKLATFRAFVLGALLSLGSAPAAADDYKDVRAAHLAFEQAMNGGDAEAVKFWIHPAYTSFTGNGGLINDSFDAGALQANFDRGLSLATRTKHMQVKVWGASALVTGYAEGMVSRPGGTPTFEVSRVSAVYMMDEGRWKQAHIHQSPVAPSAPRALQPAAPRAVVK